MRPSRALAALVFVLVAAAVAAAALRIPPPPDRRVNDYANALSPADRERLEQKLAARERSSSNQVVVAIFPSLEGESLEDFSIRLAQAWRIGQKSLDNGVIFLVFLKDRKMRIEVGYGLEPTLTDAITSSILRNDVAPRFREGKIADGISAGVDAIEQAIAGTYQQSARRPASQEPQSVDYLGLIMLFLVLGGLGLAVLPPLLSYRGPGRQGYTGRSSGWGGPMIGGGGWSRGGGGFGGGGFGGGGGSFGGGGASGSW